MRKSYTNLYSPGHQMQTMEAIEIERRKVTCQVTPESTLEMSITSVYEQTNAQAIQEGGHLYRFSKTVWATILGDRLIGSYPLQ